MDSLCRGCSTRSSLHQPGRHGGEPVRVRMGLHTGEAIKDADDFFGRNVIFAARIADEAEGGDVGMFALMVGLPCSPLSRLFSSRRR